ncbi:MAG: D-alanine--D-alanine ligase [Methylococcaceae bacterium]|nr:D-alanine--D-alanine ligase [Methylococcaceae bacterium]
MTQSVNNPTEFGKVAVAMGGNSAEREISLSSGQAVLAALHRKKVDAVGVDIGDCAFRALSGQSFDRVFNIVHGRGGEDGVLQGFLEAMGLPYTGSGVLASAIAMDKLKTKLIWKATGLPTPRWVVLHSDEDLLRCERELGFPFIVKPTQEGSSIGMTKVNNCDELPAARRAAALDGRDIIAEAWISGREYTAGFLQDLRLPLIRLETPNNFYDFDAKYRSNSTRYHCPCGLDAKLEQELQDLAAEACAAVAVRGWGRVDLFLDNQANPWLIEVNTVPGMTDHSLIPMAAKALGIGFDELVWKILETSMAGDPGK